MNKSIIKTTVQGAVKPQVYNVRGKRVVLDRAVAQAFGVETKVLNQKVKRNLSSFTDGSVFSTHKRGVSIGAIFLFKVTNF